MSAFFTESRCCKRVCKRSKVSASQVSTEFMALIGFLALIFLITAFIAFDRNRDVHQRQLYSEAWEMCQTLATEINTAVMIGPGYEHLIQFPEYLGGGRNYGVEVNNLERVVNVSDENGVALCLMPILANNTQGTLRPSPGNQYILRNVDGVIRIDPP